MYVGFEESWDCWVDHPCLIRVPLSLRSFLVARQRPSFVAIGFKVRKTTTAEVSFAVFRLQFRASV